MTKTVSISKDLANKKIHVVREFNAPVEKVWKAWTDSSVLDKWWAPKPWRAETKTFDFREGGLWLYAMVGPDGTKAWCRVAFNAIAVQKSFKAVSTFSDEQGITDTNFPLMYWSSQFRVSDTGTTVEVAISFDEEADMQKILEMGFEGGFTMALGNLDELLDA